MNRFPTINFSAIAFTGFLLFGLVSPANGQTNEPTVGMKPAFPSETEEPVVQNAGESDDGTGISKTTPANTGTLWRPETILALSLILFCLIVLYVQYRLVMKDTVDWTPNTIIRFFGLTLIINGGVLLVVAGFSSQQIAGVLGLLGSIAGYLLGASSKGSTDGDSRTAANSRVSSAPTENEND